MKNSNIKDFLQTDIDQLSTDMPEFIDHLISKIDYHISK